MSIINYSSNNNPNCMGYLVNNNPSPKIGLVILQEWWGLNEQIKALSNRYANDGPFIVLAPDLYHGKNTSDALEAQHLMEALDWSNCMNELDQAKDYLIHSIGCTSVAIMGFCMGGALTLSSISQLKGFSAGVCFYGIPRDLIIENISCPVQCHFGSLDEIMGFTDYQTAKKLQDALLTKAKVKNEVHFYETGHAFMNEKGEKYHEPSAKIAYPRSLDFIRSHCQ